MQRFAELFEALDTTTSTNDKVAAMVGYLRSATPEDAAWAVYVLIGRRPSFAASLVPFRRIAGRPSRAIRNLPGCGPA